MGKDSTTKISATAKENEKSNEKNKGMSLQVLTEKQIETYKIPKEQLWYISVKGGPVGPFHRDDLRNFLDESPTFPRDTKVANYVQQVWVPLFKAPEFQRRRPQLIPRSDAVENKEFHLLQNGQKAGPFTLEHVSQKIDEKQLLITDLISIDQGESWMKIFECPYFDRRHRVLRDDPQTPLPAPPHEDFFAKSQEELKLLRPLEKLHEVNDEEEGLIGLAYIGKLRSKSLHNSTQGGEDIFSEDKSKNLLSSNQVASKKWTLKHGIFFLLLVSGLASGLYYYKKHLNSPAPDQQFPSELEEVSGLPWPFNKPLQVMARVGP